VWKVFGMPYRDEPAFETGQWMVNKEMCWRELLTSDWLCQHSDYVFNHVYGDKEAFHLGWRLLRRDYAMPSRGPSWNVHTIIQHDFTGREILLHRVQDKWRLHGGNRVVESLTDERLHFQLVEQLREIWPGTLWINPVPNETERTMTRNLLGCRFNDRRIGLDERVIQLGAGGRIVEGDAECERRWSIHQRGQEMILAVCSDSKLTFLTRLDDKGNWRGHWLEHERCEVELIKEGQQHIKPKDLTDDLHSAIASTLKKYALPCGQDSYKTEVNEIVRCATALAGETNGNP
jgi:hypothetical protein